MGKSALAEKMVSPVTLSIMYQIDQRISNAIYPLPHSFIWFEFSCIARFAYFVIARENWIFFCQFRPLCTRCSSVLRD